MSFVALILPAPGTLRAALSTLESHHHFVLATSNEDLWLSMSDVRSQDADGDASDKEASVRAEAPPPSIVRKPNGLYRKGNVEPIWTIEWFDNPGNLFLSDDGTCLVRINYEGYRNYVFGGPRWGVRFYVRGVEIRSWDASDLVDYGSLLPYTSDGAYRWISENTPPTLRDGVFYLRTNSHESYLFDATTGLMQSEFRLWRTLARWSTAASGLSLVIAVVVVCRRRSQSQAVRMHLKTDGSADCRLNAPRFGLSSLFLATVIAAVLCWLAMRPRHVAIFSISITIALLLTAFLLRLRANHKYTVDGSRSRVVYSIVTVTMVVSWFASYLLSMAPALGILDRLGVAHDIQMVVARVPYYPAYRLLSKQGIRRHTLVEGYFSDWREQFKIDN